MKYKIPLQAISLFSLIIVWIVLSKSLPSIIVPNPADVVSELTKLLYSGELLNNLLISLMRTMAGLWIATVFAVPIGIALGWNRSLYEFFELEIDFFRSLPIVAFIPLIIFVLGIGDISKIFIIAFGCFWPILINTIHGTRSIEDIHIKVADTMNVNSKDLLFKIIIPISSPQIFNGIKISLSISLILMVVSEMIAGSNGLGYMLVEGSRTYNMEKMMIGIIVIGTLGYVLNRLFSFVVEGKLLKWYYIDKRQSE